VKARKRVVTTRRQVAARRTPTVRRIKSAIVPAVKRPVPASSRSGDSHAGGASTPDRSVDLTVDLGRGLVLANPIVAASGPFGYGVEVVDSVDLGLLGALVTRGTTLRARAGAPPPRMATTPSGLLHAVSFQNPGVDAVIEKHEPAWRGWRVPVVVNVCGESVGEFVEVVRRLEGLSGVAGVELNLGCPNRSRGGSPFAFDADAAASLVAAVRRTWDRCLVAKLSAGAADVRSVARAVAGAGADAISAINPVAALAVGGVRDRERARDRTLFGGAGAGLSGPAIRPIAMRVVHEVVGAVGIPVVAYGGVITLDDVLDYLAVGAAAVGVGAAALADPSLPVRLAEELADACSASGFTSYRALVGTSRR
jgi:dihydroorotate dehydrogenase (NAD+) catalytic subunit